jgi:hypothetical protein
MSSTVLRCENAAMRVNIYETVFEHRSRCKHKLQFFSYFQVRAANLVNAVDAEQRLDHPEMICKIEQADKKMRERRRVLHSVVFAVPLLRGLFLELRCGRGKMQRLLARLRIRQARLNGDFVVPLPRRMKDLNFGGVVVVPLLLLDRVGVVARQMRQKLQFLGGVNVVQSVYMWYLLVHTYEQ